MGKHFPDGPVLFTLIASLITVAILSLAFDCNGDNQERKQQGQAIQVIV